MIDQRSSQLVRTMVAAVGLSTILGGIGSGLGCSSSESGGPEGVAPGVPEHTCIQADGDLYCWGGSRYISLSGQHSSADVSPPVRVELGMESRVLAQGDHMNCAASEDTVMCWGDVTTMDAGPYGDRGASATRTFAEESTQFLAVGTTHVCGSDGSTRVWCAGWQVQDEELTLPSPVVALAAVYDATCALLESGELYCWGHSTPTDYQLGNVTPAAPTRVPGVESAVAFGLGRSLLCVLQADETVSCTRGCWSPSGTETGLTPIAGVSDVQELAVGAEHACARTTDGVVCWGTNWDAEASGCTAPVDVPDAADGLVVRGHHTCVRNANSVTCWGSNWHQQLGGPTSSPDLGTVSFDLP